MSNQLEGSNIFTGDFAKLVPRNRVAQLLFSRTYSYAEKDDLFHFQFMDCTGGGGGPLAASDKAVESSTDYSTYSDSDTEGSRSNSVQNLGCFILSFNQRLIPEMPYLAWRVGRGTSKLPPNRGVDLLLAKPRDLLGKSLASIHMVFRFNPESGFLMLGGGSPKEPVELNKSGVWEKLEYGKEQVVHEVSTMIRAGDAEYDLKYTVEEQHREAYFSQRDALLTGIIEGNRNSQRPAFRKIPGDNCVIRGRYLEFETLGCGGFGWVTQGVDIQSGDPIAIKEFRINSLRDRLKAAVEARMGNRFLNKRGLLPTLDASCEHGPGHRLGCCDLEKFYLVMPRAMTDLVPNFWNTSSIPRTTKFHWLRELLEGIQNLHAMGIMHRDIRLRNMLIMSVEPPRASLCDYGNATRAESSKFTEISPRRHVAPEVWDVTAGPYTAKIDMWAFGYAIAEILGYPSETLNDRISKDRYSMLLYELFNHTLKATEDEPLVELVMKLLIWEPERRWSADQALQHRCWSLIVPQEGK